MHANIKNNEQTKKTNEHEKSEMSQKWPFGCMEIGTAILFFL